MPPSPSFAVLLVHQHRLESVEGEAEVNLGEEGRVGGLEEGWKKMD